MKNQLLIENQFLVFCQGFKEEVKKMAFKEALTFFTLTLLLLIGKCQSIATHSDLQCFLPGECTNGTLLTAQASTNEYECLDLCKSQANSTWFTFYPETNGCLLFESCGRVDETHCQLCLSGQKECSAPEPECWVQGFCHGNVIHTEQPTG